MLNPFPIQFLALFAYFLLRISVGSILLYLGLQHWRSRHELKTVLTLSWWPYGYFSTIVLATSELIIATSFLFGAYTQIAALCVIAMSVKLLILRGRFNHATIPPRLFYVLLFGAALSLFITGGGAFAFDLPL